MMHGNKAIIITGSPAAGKSTYGKQLATLLGAAFLDIDICTERMVRAGMNASGHSKDDRDSAFFKSNFRDAIYETLFDIAKDNLSHQSVVIVGPFTKEIRDKGWPDRLQERLGVHVEVHYVYCDPAVRKSRIVSRGESRDIQKIENWEEINSYYGEEVAPEFEHVWVDGGQ